MRNVEDFSYNLDAATWIMTFGYMLYGIAVLSFLYSYWDVLFSIMSD